MPEAEHFTDKNQEVTKTMIMKKGIGPRGLGISPLKQADYTKEQEKAIKRNYPNFNRETDTLISGTSNSLSGARHFNTYNRKNALNKGKIKDYNIKKSFAEKKDGKTTYYTVSEKNK